MLGSRLVFLILEVGSEVNFKRNAYQLRRMANGLRVTFRIGVIRGLGIARRVNCFLNCRVLVMGGKKAIQRGIQNRV